MSAKGLLFAFGLGITAGASVALLYAPQSGAKTRRKLSQGFDDSAEYLEDAAENLKKQAEALGNDAQKLLERAKGQFGDAVDSGSTAVTSAIKGVAKSVQSLV